jgi:uncharacterized protein
LIFDLNPNSSDVGSNFLERLVRFCEILREEQFGTTPAETLDAACVVMMIDISRIEDFRRALKSALVKRSEDYERFDRLFTIFWLPAGKNRQENPLGRVSIPGRKIERTLRIPDSQINQTGKGRITAGAMFASTTPDSQDAEKLLGIYSPLETTSRKSFGDLYLAEDRALLKRGLRSLAKATATRPGRRFRISQDGNEFDFRRTLRANLKTGGHTVDFELRSKKLTKSRLVIFCDISGSMDSYSDRVLKLIYHLSNTIKGSQIFGFSTRVESLNTYLQGKSLREASQLVSKKIDFWSSGTRIGSALGDLLSNHSGVLRSSTVFIVISDGWELGDIPILRSRLNEIRRRVAAIIWLNPQADSPDYVPLAEGMKSSLPYVDVFAGLDIFSNRTKFRRAFGRVRLQN